MFNVRVKRFLDSEQIQIFSDCIRENFDDRHYNALTGEIYGTGELLHIPFEEGLVAVKHFGDAEYNLSKSFVRTKKRVYDYVRSNSWEWFLTLTFAPDKVDRYDYAEVSKKLHYWFSNMKKKCPDMKYVVVPERHKDGAFHFHGLFANVDGLRFVDSGKKDKQGRVIFNVGKYRLGFTTATRIEHTGKASSYLMKYITKDLCSVTKGKKRYWVSRNVDEPVVTSYLVGLSEMDILKMLEGVENIKKVHSEYADVTYIETSIYTTNAQKFVQNSINANRPTTNLDLHLYESDYKEE